MPETCKVCGLPKELCVCEDIAREQQNIKIYAAKRRFGRWITVVEGIVEREIDIRDVAKTLKSRLACGGTLKDGKIELQGDHREKVREILIDLGFSTDTIDVK